MNASSSMIPKRPPSLGRLVASLRYIAQQGIDHRCPEFRYNLVDGTQLLLGGLPVPTPHRNMPIAQALSRKARRVTLGAGAGRAEMAVPVIGPLRPGRCRQGADRGASLLSGAGASDVRDDALDCIPADCPAVCGRVSRWREHRRAASALRFAPFCRALTAGIFWSAPCVTSSAHTVPQPQHWTGD